MRVGIAHFSTALVLASLYLVLPCLGWVLGGIAGASVGVVLAFLVGRFWPKWGRDLDWNDLVTFLTNLREFGADGARLHLILKDRSLFVYRDNRNGEKRMAVQFFDNEWQDILSDEDIEALARDFNAECYRKEEWKDRSCTYIQPQNCDTGVARITKHLIELSDGFIHSDVLARVDYAARRAWQRHPDAEYSNVL